MVTCLRKYFRAVSGIKTFAHENQIPVLQTAGLHSLVRHPLYLGTLIFIWSIFFLVPLWSNLIACGIITIYTVAGIHFEERKLIKEFKEILQRCFPTTKSITVEFT